MVRLSATAALGALAAVIVAQDDAPSALPEQTAQSGMTCGGCYVVADVAGVVFGNAAVQTVSEIVVTANNNGSAPTTITTTISTNNPVSVTQAQGQATITTNAGNVGAAPGVVTQFNSGSTVIVNGATLTSPTQYEVFTGFVVVRSVSAGGSCIASTGSKSTLGSAIQYAIPSGAGSDFLNQAQSSFINSIGFPECSNGGSNVQSTINVQASTTTESITTDSLPTAGPSGSYTVPNITSAPSIQPAFGGSVQAVNPSAAFGSAAALAIAVGVLAVWL